MKTYRLTKQCQIIHDSLIKLCNHPSAEELYEVVKRVDKNISLGTVYRNLEKLNKQGEVLKFYTGDGIARWDKTVDNHHHIKCKSCGKVKDVFGLNLSLLEAKICADSEFNDLSIIIEINGLCFNCQKRGK